MNRVFDKVTAEQLKSHVEGILYGEYNTIDWYRIADQVGKIKVRFDTENLDISPSSLAIAEKGMVDFLGIHTLPNGLTFWGMRAGGDWELPVCFIIYLAKGQLRLYVPKDGNLWNTTSKAAYGNTEDDTRNAYKRFYRQTGPLTLDEIAETDVTDLQLEADVNLILADILLRFSE